VELIPRLDLSVFKRNPGVKEGLDIEEAFNLWLQLRTRYHNIEGIQIHRNFIHDRDFAVAVNRVADAYDRQVQVLEDELKYFDIKMPEKPAKDAKTSQKGHFITDAFIYRLVSRQVVEDAFAMSRAVRTSTTNDRLRALFTGFLREQLGVLEVFIEYGKVKEWQDPAPTYKTAKAVRKEQLDVGEAFHLWDHLSLRYDQRQLTDFFVSFAHDAEYQAIMQLGLRTLDQQIDRLEKAMLQFEIPLPPRPPESVKAPVDPETLEDRFTYRTLTRGIQEAIDLHLRAIVETTRNDSLRRVYTDFLFTELKLFDRLIKYGKAKAWLHTPPAYSEIVS